MRELRQVTGRAAVLDRADVDTDQIIPKQFLKRIERSGFGPFLFYDWRRNDPGFVLNPPEYEGASVLVAGPNFGCGSSREHAAWALEDAGFRAVLAPSFGDIFRTNATKTGLAPIELAEAELAEEDPTTTVTVDLESQTASAAGFSERFELDPYARECLLNGWDAIALTLRHEDEIAAYEARRENWLPVVTGG